MKFRHYALLLTSICLIAASPSFASQKSALRQAVGTTAQKPAATPEKPWSALNGLPVANADVPEAEPNDTLQDANPISCGDDYRPAAIDVPDDIDILVITATAGDLITFGTDADGAGDIGDTVVGIFDDLGNLLDSDDDGGPGLYSLLLDYPAPYTGTFYLAVIAYDVAATGNYQAFVRCAAAQPPPGNDTCAGAIKLDCKDFNVQGTTVGANNDYTPSDTFGAGCTGYTAAGADVVYLVTLPDGGSLSADYTSAADGSLYLVDSCVSPSDGACLVGADNTFTGETESLTYTNNSGSSQTLYLICDNYGTGGAGSFTLTGTMSCPPVPVQATTWGSLKAIYKN